MKTLKGRYQVIVIGGGPAGLAAAISAKRSGTKDVLLIERDRYLGGILHQCIHTGFGLKKFKEDLSGPEYAARYLGLFMAQDIDYLTDTSVIGLDNKKNVRITNKELGIRNIASESIVLAMGCRERTRNNILIPGDRPSGIWTAGTAQRLMNLEGLMIGKEIVILGSGDIGLIMARRCMIEGALVKAVMEILPYPSGLNRNVCQCLDDFGIPLYVSHTVSFLEGDQRLRRLHYCRVDERLEPMDDKVSQMDCDTLLLSVGLVPENELSAQAGVVLDPDTCGPVLDNAMQSPVSGVFACGNVAQVYDVVDSVSESGELAGKCAALYSKGLLGTPQKSTCFVKGKNIKSIFPRVLKDYPLDGKKDTLSIRVDSVIDAPVFRFRNAKGPVFEIRKPYAVPSEMVEIKIKKYREEILDNPEISIEGESDA